MDFKNAGKIVLTDQATFKIVSVSKQSAKQAETSLKQNLTHLATRRIAAGLSGFPKQDGSGEAGEARAMSKQDIPHSKGSGRAMAHKTQDIVERVEAEKGVIHATPKPGTQKIDRESSSVGENGSNTTPYAGKRAFEVGAKVMHTGLGWSLGKGIWF